MFSVVVPLYNKELFIRRTVESVLAQTYENFELIVVDDGSTDASLEVLAMIDDPRLRVVSQENGGEGAARNCGMRLATLPWIALLDADDYWFPNHLAELATLIEMFPDTGMVATSFIEGEDWQAQQPPTTNARRSRINYLSAASRDIGIVWSSDVALRRSVTEKVGGFASFRRGADLHYWVRMALAAPVGKSTLQTAYYFRNDQSIMASTGDEPIVSDLAEIWPPISLFGSLDIASLSDETREGIRMWTRNAAYLTILQNIMAGHAANARLVASQISFNSLDRASVIKLAAQFPAWLIALAVGNFRASRGVLRTFRRIIGR